MIWQNFMLALSKYATFSGRSRRAEFWGFFLITLIFGGVANFWDNLIFDREIFGSMLDMAFFIPTIAVSARRLHDIGRSGWWQLIALTGIGVIVLLVWYAKDSDFDSNQFGDSPKYGADGKVRDIPIEDEQIV